VDDRNVAPSPPTILSVTSSVQREKYSGLDRPATRHSDLGKCRPRCYPGCSVSSAARFGAGCNLVIASLVTRSAGRGGFAIDMRAQPQLNDFGTFPTPSLSPGVTFRHITVRGRLPRSEPDLFYRTDTRGSHVANVIAGRICIWVA